MMRMKPKFLTPHRKYLISSLLFLVISALVCTWWLEYRYFLNDFFRVWSFVFGMPFVYFYNAAIVLAALLLLWSVIRRPEICAGLVWTLFTIITYVHINKFNSRGFPLLPEDFQLASEASSLSKFVDIWGIVRMVIAIILFWGLLLLFRIKLAKKLGLTYHSKDRLLWRRFAVIERIVLFAVSLFALFALTDFARHSDGARYTDTFLGTHFTAWNQNRNYDDNGFILGFLYNLQKLRIDAPDGYGEYIIHEIRDTYSEIAVEQNEKRKNPAEEEVSFVVILNESFYDPTAQFQGIKFEDYYPHDGGDVTPVLHSLQQKYPSGQMYSLDYGGGTANIEFEAFTGLTNYWVNTVPYTALIPKAGEVPSIATMMKTSGYSTTAIHSYNAGMYKRNIALGNEGFDVFISDVEMRNNEHDGNSEYINDRSIYKETLDVLNSTEKSQVIGVVTMQNHTPYSQETYDQLDFHITAENGKVDRKDEIEVYFQSVHNSDQYLGEFIEELEKIDKKVVVLFFGDHSAGLFNEINSNEQKKVRDLARVTPYLIYTNFDARYQTKSLPTTTPNCMVNTMLNTLNYQKDPIYYLLDDVCQEEPILTATWLEDKVLSDSEIMMDYELVTYDILSGKKYWQD